MKKMLAIIALALSIPAMSQVINCPSGFSSSGACGTSLIGGGGQNFAIVGTQNNITPSLSGSRVLLAPTGAAHTALSLNYQTPVKVQAFTTTFTFVPNGSNVAFVINNATNGSSGPNFSSGAGCEGGFFQAFVPPNALANNILSIEMDSYSYLNSGGTFTYSSTQLYNINQSPCNPNDSGPNFWLTNKINTSPVPLTSPASTQGSATGDTYSATISYDGSNLNLCLYDVTLAVGSCSSGTSGTGTYFQQTWSAVDIPSMVKGNTAYVGFTEGTGEASASPLYINSWTYTANTAPSLPSLSTYTTQSYAGAPAAASPTFSPAAGTYSGTQNVTISCPTSGSYPVYVLATPSSTTLLPWPDSQGGAQTGTAGSTVSVSSSKTLYAVCGLTYAGLPSAQTSAAYVITGGGALAAPTFTPAAGTYSSAQFVTINLPSGSTGCYTTDGSTPTATTPGTCSHGTPVGGSVTVNTSETLNVIATEVGYTNSSVGTAAYVISAASGSVFRGVMSPGVVIH